MMDTVAAVSALLGAAIGAGASLLTMRMQLRQQLEVLRLERKAEDQAESVARKLLSHDAYFDRRFEAIKTALGGFEDDELRRILVRAGAIRVTRSDGDEWWTLLDREQERIDKARLKEGRSSYEPDCPSSTPV